MIWPRSRLLEVHVAHHARHDLDRGNRQRDPEERRGRQPAALVRDERGGQPRPSARPGEERNCDPRQGDAQRRPAQPLHQPGSLSMPVSASRRRMPNSPNAWSAAFAAGSGERARARACGETAPRREGPSRMPATSCPSTGGWPRRCAASPRRRAASRMTTIETRKPGWKVSRQLPTRVARLLRVCFDRSAGRPRSDLALDEHECTRC